MAVKLQMPGVQLLRMSITTIGVLEAVQPDTGVLATAIGLTGVAPVAVPAEQEAFSMLVVAVLRHTAAGVEVPVEVSASIIPTHNIMDLAARPDSHMVL